MEQTVAKIEGLIQKLEQSYLDPDTARKIGTAKQQFRIQRDRRKQLLLSANYDSHSFTSTQHTSKPPSHPSDAHAQRPEESASNSTWGRFLPK
jgi:hypothetical protein